MRVYDGTYWSTKYNIRICIAVAISFIGLPLAIYLHFKYLVPEHLNVGVYLMFASTIFIIPFAFSFKTTAFIDGENIIFTRRLFINAFKSKDELLTRQDINKVEIVSDWQSNSCNLKLARNSYLSLINVDPQFKEWITLNFHGKIHEKNVTEKQSYKVGMLIIFGVIIYVLLLFAVTFLATAKTVP